MIYYYKHHITKKGNVKTLEISKFSLDEHNSTQLVDKVLTSDQNFIEEFVEEMKVTRYYVDDVLMLYYNWIKELNAKTV